ncbi:PAS domain S-box protein [uncultured Cyclobacterium sp.]|uniref:PAS domain S-box protein n=1 Tax=uncultured Cyclobacterium sp. TaxID=453820 RepID=UPI0030EEE9D0|tara:strand:- start:66389 stop:69028 length:2640 start_codon:yes stop_codon:yes gene_type:complete
MANDLGNSALNDLKSLQILDTLPEKEYDEITGLAALICNTPVSLVSLVTDTRQFFKSNHGLTDIETPITWSFCAHAVKSPEQIFLVKDARKDERFKDNPMVTGKPHIVFYAGMPLVSKDGNALGTLCVLDKQPRSLEKKQLEALKSLANQVVQLFELRKNRIEIKEIGDNLSLETIRLNNIINATRAGIWEWNIVNGKVTVNERWAEMLGYTLKELEPFNFESFQKLIYPGDAMALNEKVKACVERKSEFYEGEFRFLHKKGFIVWVHDLGKVVSWAADGQPLLMAGTHTDITERKNTEIQFQTITNNIPGAVFRYKRYPNGEGEVQLLSNGAKNLWGFSAEEIMQNNNLIWQRFKKNDLDAFLLTIQKSAEDLSFWEHEWPYYHPNGTTQWHKGSGSPSRLEDGSTIWDAIILDFTHQKEIELEIEQSEKRFKALVQNGSDLIAILDIEGNYLYVSPTSTLVLGTPPEKYIGKNAFELIHPDFKKTVYESLLCLKQLKHLAIKPFRFKHGDGSWRWIETIFTNLMDDSAVGGIVANSRDVTERILTEEKLKKSEAYFRGLYESQTNYVVRTDMNGDYTYVNKKFIEEFGWVYADGKILGENCMSSIMEYHHQKVQGTVEECIAEPGKVFKIELDKPSTNGRIITTLWDFICVLDANGAPSEMQALGLDISDRIQHEKALKESEQRYANLFHLSPQPMWVYDLATLKFLDVNKAAIKHYGYSYDEFLNMTLREIRPKSEIPKLEAAVLQIIQNEGGYNRDEYLHKKRNGQEIIVEIQSNALTYQGKDAEVILATDITERYKHIQAIEGQNQKFKKIAWMQSHGVRAPLARIMGLVELLRADSESLSEDEKEQVLKFIMTSATELDEVIRKIVQTSHEAL